MEITLDQLLESREQRSALQRELLDKYPDATLVCLTVIMPGKVKRNSFSLITAGAALQQVTERYGNTLIYLSTRDLATGYEAYAVTTMSREQAKRLACDIEDSHPLGRLFDIDVIEPDGSPLPRTAVGHGPRQCLLCDNEARYCMRNHTHTQQELQAHIVQLINDYVL